MLAHVAHGQPSSHFPIRLGRDSQRLADQLTRYPHSLSYQLITLTRSPSTTCVIPRSTTDARESLMMSDETTGSW